LRRTRRTVSIAGIVLLLCLCLWAQELLIRSSADQVHVTAPQFHFLTGKPLDRIRNGNAVAFDFQLSALGESKVSVLRRSFERFVISYDLWEEKFSVARMRSKHNSAPNLSAAGAEAWCIENIALSSSGLPQDAPIYIRLEVRAQDPREQNAVLTDPGISLSGLIDIFSRAAKTQPQNFWRLEAGPLRLADFNRKTSVRGAD
jgi:hypothetical protein